MTSRPSSARYRSCHPELVPRTAVAHRAARVEGSPPIARLLLVCLLLAGLTLAVYWRVSSCGFINFDDDVYVTSNPHVTGGISWESVRWAFTATHAGNWHPLTWISHMLDCRFFGLHSGGHHLTSLVIHILSSLLLLLALNRMTGSIWRSAFVAAIFALHPLHVESVAWVAERKDVLSTFFVMLTILAYLHYTRRPNLRRYLLVTLAFILGLMCKPMLVTLPLILLLLDFWPFNRLAKPNNHVTLSLSLGRQRPAGLRESKGLPSLHSPFRIRHSALLLLSFASCIITFIAQRRGGAVAPFESFSPGVRIANACVSYIGYIVKTFWPQHLAVYYPHPGTSLPAWEVWGSVLLLIGLVALAVRVRKTHPYVTMGLAWYLITLIPVIGIIQVGGQAMADRYTYVPMIGLSIAIIWGIHDLITRRFALARPAMAVAAGAAIIALCICTARQVGYWRNSVTLFSHAMAVTGPNYVADDNLGQALMNQGRGREAIPHFEAALAIKPDDTEAHVNLGIALSLQHRYAEAIEHFSTALKIRPNHPKAHYNLASVFVRQGKLEAAATHFSRAIKSDPLFTAAHVGFANASLLLGRRDEAADHFSEALRLGSKDPTVHFCLGTIFEDRGNLADAIRHYREALRLDPHRWDAANNLAWTLATQTNPAYRDPGEAVRLAEISCRATGYTEPQLVDTLAVAYASAGRYSDAASAAKKALYLTLSAKQYEAAKPIRERLRAYQAALSKA